MKVSGSVHSFTIPFRIPAGEGHFIERSVRAFLVAGRETCLIDAGVAGSAGSLLALAGNAGGDPGGISTLVLTHSHPDHMGGGLAIQRATGCIVAAHPAEVGWIEDPEQQARERPVPGFSTLVEGPVRVDRLLGDGDRIGIGGGRHLAVIHTPGHSPGSISLFLGEEGVLFTGDAIPVKGGFPVYDDPLASLESIRKLGDLKGVRALLSSWDTLKTGEGIRQALAEGEEVIRGLHAVVVRAAEKETDPVNLTRIVIGALGLPLSALPLIARTVNGHLRVPERGGR